MSDLSHLRSDFPIFANGGGHFLDSAASAQKPATVIEAMAEFARTGYANVHRGAYRLSVEATERYESARRRAGLFINAATPEEVVLTRGTTTALNMVAFGWGLNHLVEGDRILLTVMEHHANLVPWQMVARRTGAKLDFVPLTENYRLDIDRFLALLDADVRVVAVTGMSNVLGTMPPIGAMAAAAHLAGAIMVVDGAQLVPHVPVDVQSLGADFLAFSGHKLVGPTGIGVLWGRPDRLEEMEPFEGGGEMISDVQLHSSTWAAIPHRFEAGTPPIIEAVGLESALDYLGKVGMDEVRSHDLALCEYAMRRMAEIPSVTIHGPADLEDRGGVLSFTMGDIHPHDIATILDQGGVSVRAGHHCAKPLHRTLGRVATARASFNVYNDRADIDALITGLHKAGELFGVS